MIDDLDRYFLSDSLSLLEALRRIDESAAGIGIVAQDRCSFAGVITDGDIRRAFINGKGFDDPIGPHITRNPFVVGPETTRREVVELMQIRNLLHVPVVFEGQIMGLHLLREAIPLSFRPNTAVILAGGFGSRLGDLTKQTPKPMLKVAGVPILERIVHRIVNAGIRDIQISVHFKPEVIQNHFGDGSAFSCNIRYLHEIEPMGTAGCLSLLGKMDQDILLLNGDILADINLELLLDAHEKAQNDVTMATKKYVTQIPFGCVQVDAKGRVNSLIEKPLLEETINAGIYVISTSVLAKIPKRFIHITEIIEQLLEGERKVGTFDIETDWIDIGRPSDLDKARGKIQ